jgi:hypothetical protein
MNHCPWCQARAIDITTSDDLTGFDRRPHYLCSGPDAHEWREGEGPQPPQESLIVLARN